MEVRYEQERNRAAAYDGSKEIGECTYHGTDGLWTIDHTQVDKAYQGQGIARKLVDMVAVEARKAGVGLAATCSYAKNVLERNTEYGDLLRR